MRRAGCVVLAAVAWLGCGKLEMISQKVEPAAQVGESAPASPAPVDSAAPTEDPHRRRVSTRAFYVSTAGSDAAAGSASLPFRTIEHGIDVLKPGEALLVRGGTYTERLVIGANAADVASSARPIFLLAAPGSVPLLRGGTGSKRCPAEVRRAFWVIEGLTIDVARDPAFAVFFTGSASHHQALRNCELKNGAAGAGITVADFASQVLLENNHIHHFSKSGDSKHGILVQTTAHTVIVRRNNVHHNSGDAVQCIGQKPARRARERPSMICSSKTMFSTKAERPRREDVYGRHRPAQHRLRASRLVVLEGRGYGLPSLRARRSRRGQRAL